MPRPADTQPVTVTFDSQQDAFCPVCNYNLRAASGSGCPECGADFHIANPRRVRRQGLYLNAVMITSFFALPIVSYLPPILYVTAMGNVTGYWDFPNSLPWVANMISVPYLALLICFTRKITEAALGVRLAWAIPPMLLFAGMTVFWWYYWLGLV